MTTLHHPTHHPHHTAAARRLLPICPLHPAATPSASFCASCLRERLSVIDPSALHEIPKPSAPRPDHLRRCSSYSAARRDCGSSAHEPRRRSCDSRAQSSTLSDLFTVDDAGPGLKVESLSGLEEDENELEGEEIRVGVPLQENAADNRRFYGDVDFGGDVELKTMKEFIDLELHSKKQPKRETRAFWGAASVFSKRLTKWRRKEKIENEKGGEVNCSSNDPRNVSEKLDQGKLRVKETRSEVGEYGLGRRSCDTDPRLSVDAGRFLVDGGRFSLDVGRVSFDEPRASWDGYLIGGRGYNHHHHHNQRFNPMVSFLEDVKVIDTMLKNRALVEEQLNVVDEEGRSPGGSIQTRDYYNDSAGSQRRRRSFDRSNSHRKGPLLEADELKPMSNAKVSPATTELFYGAKLLISEGKLRASDSKIAQDDSYQNIIESVSKSAMPGAGGTDPSQCKKLQKWGKVRSIWGLIQRRNESKYVDDEKIGNGCLADPPVPDSWQTPNRVSVEGEVNGVIGSRLVRSCSVSARNSGATAIEARGILDMKTREECIQQKNQSMKNPPSNIDSGLLRFYLTPLRSSRSKSMKSRLRKAHSVTKGATNVVI